MFVPAPAKRLLTRIVVNTVKALAALAAMSAASYAVTASAAPSEHYTAFGWHSTQFDVKPFSEDVPKAWNAALENATHTWNAAHSDVHITIDENSRNTLTFVSGFAANDGREAEYKKLCLPTGCWFEITIQEDFLDLSGDEVGLRGQYLILHELGHALGLNDFTSDSDDTKSVMALYAKPNKKPTLHKYDYQLIAERVQLMKSGPIQVIPTLTFGVLRPAAEWVASALTPEETEPAEPSKSPNYPTGEDRIPRTSGSSTPINKVTQQPQR